VGRASGPGIFAIIILVMVVYQLIRGEALDNLFKWRKRSADPVNFWLIVLAQGVAALVLLAFAAPGVIAAL
jgi:Ni/Fe-hydrogenase subunit HybB-like protein